MKNIEIEKKFLLSSYPLESYLARHNIDTKSKRLRQFYLPDNDCKYRRYREDGDKFIKTCKRGSGAVREEIEEYITKDEFTDALKRFGREVLSKRRVIFEIDNYRFELDIFDNPLKGLQFLEIEFSDISKLDSFCMPKLLEPFILYDVTDAIQFTNAFIAKSLSYPILHTTKTIEKSNSIKFIGS